MDCLADYLAYQMSRLRRERGISLKQLSAETGLSATQLDALERGAASIGLDELELVAQALSVDLQTILSGAPSGCGKSMDRK